MENRLVKIREYTQAALDTLLVARSKFALLEPLMKSETLVKRFGGGLRVQARNIMISTLYLDCSLSLLAISLDSDRRAASVCNVLHMLEAEDLRVCLRDEFSKPRTIYDISDSFCEETKEQRLKEWAQQENISLQKSFDETYQHTKKGFDDFKDGKVCQRLRSARDKVHAHKEMVLDEKYPRLKTLEELGVEVGDLRSLMDAVEDLLLKLEEIVKRSNTSFHIINEQSKSMAKDFWGIETD